MTMINMSIIMIKNNLYQDPTTPTWHHRCRHSRFNNQKLPSLLLLNRPIFHQLSCLVITFYGLIFCFILLSIMCAHWVMCIVFGVVCLVICTIVFIASHSNRIALIWALNASLATFVKSSVGCQVKPDVGLLPLLRQMELLRFRKATFLCRVSCQESTLRRNFPCRTVRSISWGSTMYSIFIWNIIFSRGSLITPTTDRDPSHDTIVRTIVWCAIWTLYSRRMTSNRAF